MNENLDLTKILKDAPKGMKLWSPVYGECTFINVDYFPNVMYPIHCKATNKDGKSTYVLFTIDGRIEMCKCCCDNINHFLSNKISLMNRVI